MRRLLRTGGLLLLAYLLLAALSFGQEHLGAPPSVSEGGGFSQEQQGVPAAQAKPITSTASRLPVSSTADVDNTKMGAYRALAQLTFHSFQNGDNATAAELARILERTWDKGEEGGGEHSLAKVNNTLFEKIDHAMDLFIKPLIAYQKAQPDPSKIEAAYKEFLDDLKQAD